MSSLNMPCGVESLLVPDTVAATLAGVSRAHVHRMRAAGKWGPKAVRLGRKVLYRREEVIGWINAGCPSADLWQAMQAQRRRCARAELR
jgi:predicted DNA-binding transcriptional regulator AlpA